MSSQDDLKAHAASNEDFYALLGVSPASAEPEIRRAYRRTALKYHPDKISNPTPADIDKFHLLQIAYDVLSDPSVRQLYDNAREARERKKREREVMDATKRKMREDLEARERAGAAGVGQRGVKRPWAGMSTGVGDDDAEVKLQREIERIAEDGRRRKREAMEKLKREIDEEERVMRAEEEEERKAADRSS
ncbi:DnaJ domain protein, partial [Aspergillus sclerotialis]